MRAATRITKGAACSSFIPYILSLPEYVCSKKENREYLQRLSVVCMKYTTYDILIFKLIMSIFMFYIFINCLKIKIS